MRGQTRVPCRATTHLSRLSCQSKRCPLARQVLHLRRLTPVEVVWHRGDPPAHYTPRPRGCTPPAPRRLSTDQPLLGTGPHSVDQRPIDRRRVAADAARIAVARVAREVGAGAKNCRRRRTRTP